MVTLKVKVDTSDLERKLAGFSADMRGKEIQAAINRTAEKAKAEISKVISATYNVSAGDVRNAVSIRRKNGDGKLEARVTVFGSSRRRGRSMNLIHFLQGEIKQRELTLMGNQIKGTAKVKAKREVMVLRQQLDFLIKRNGGIKHIPGAFVGNKGRTIFKRDGKSRLPISPVQVIGYSQMFNSKSISLRVIEKVIGDLSIEIERALQIIIARNGLG